jgi:hypothetical protein
VATYSLSGSGTQALSANVTALHITITTLPASALAGSATPQNYYQVALLRFGDAVGYFDAFPVVGGPQWVAVPNGTTRLGYSCSSTAVISVVEVIGGTPPFGGGGSLAGLSDVALASLADAQVLTYQASSSKWINGTPTGGGSGPTLGQGAQVTGSTTFSVPNATSTTVTFTTLVYDTNSMWSASTPDRLTIKTAGVYVLSGQFQFSNNNVGVRQFVVTAPSGTTVARATIAPAAGLATEETVTGIHQCAVNDAIQLQVYQSSGGSLTPQWNSPSLSAQRIG